MVVRSWQILPPSTIGISQVSLRLNTCSRTAHRTRSSPSEQVPGIARAPSPQQPDLILQSCGGWPQDFFLHFTSRCLRNKRKIRTIPQYACLGYKRKKLTDMKLACLGNKRKTHSACLRNKRKKQDAGKIACLRYKRKKRTEKQGKRGEYVCEIKGKKQYCLIPFISRTFPLITNKG